MNEEPRSEDGQADNPGAPEEHERPSLSESMYLSAKQAADTGGTLKPYHATLDLYRAEMARRAVEKLQSVRSSSGE